MRPAPSGSLADMPTEPLRMLLRSRKKDLLQTKRSKHTERELSSVQSLMNPSEIRLQKSASWMIILPNGPILILKRDICPQKKMKL